MYVGMERMVGDGSAVADARTWSNSPMRRSRASSIASVRGGGRLASAMNGKGDKLTRMILQVLQLVIQHLVALHPLDLLLARLARDFAQIRETRHIRRIVFPNLLAAGGVRGAGRHDGIALRGRDAPQLGQLALERLLFRFR